MKPKDIIALRATINDRSRKELLRKNPEIVAEARKEFLAELDALKAENEALKAKLAKRGARRRKKKTEGAGDGD